MKNNDKLLDFIKKRKELFWSVRNLERLDERAIVETILNYGDWKDVQEMIKIMGMKGVAQIFRYSLTIDKFKRHNYHPKTLNYFQLYFNKYAPRNIK